MEVGAHVDEDPKPTYDFRHLEGDVVRDVYSGVELRGEAVADARKQELEGSA